MHIILVTKKKFNHMFQLGAGAGAGKVKNDRLRQPWIKDWRDTGKEDSGLQGYKKGGIWDWRDSGLSGGVYERRDSGLQRFRTGGIQE